MSFFCWYHFISNNLIKCQIYSEFIINYVIQWSNILFWQNTNDKYHSSSKSESESVRIKSAPKNFKFVRINKYSIQYDKYTHFVFISFEFPYACWKCWTFRFSFSSDYVCASVHFNWNEDRTISINVWIYLLNACINTFGMVDKHFVFFFFSRVRFNFYLKLGATKPILFRMHSSIWKVKQTQIYRWISICHTLNFDRLSRAHTCTGTEIAARTHVHLCDFAAQFHLYDQ